MSLLSKHLDKTGTNWTKSKLFSGQLFSHIRTKCENSPNKSPYLVEISKIWTFQEIWLVEIFLFVSDLLPTF